MHSGSAIVATTQVAELLRLLDRFGVEFVLVGSGAAILLGAGYTTDDVDIVPSFSEANLVRLVAALTDLDAQYFDAAGRIFRPDEGRLRENRLNLLETRLGRLDVLKSIEPGRRYEELLDRSTLLEVEGIAVRTVDLETLIEAKAIANRDKDRIHLLYLRETLRLSRLKDSAS